MAPFLFKILLFKILDKKLHTLKEKFTRNLQFKFKITMNDYEKGWDYF